MPTIEIRKQRYISKPNRQDFKKIVRHFRRKGFVVEEVLAFIGLIVRRHKNAGNAEAMADVGKLYSYLNRYLESSRFLAKAIEIKPKNETFLYLINFAFCKRYLLFHSNWAINELESVSANLLLLSKARIMNALISGNNDLCKAICNSNFEAFQNDWEFILLCLEVSLRASDGQLLCRTFNSRNGPPLLAALSAQRKERSRKLALNWLIHSIKTVIPS